MLGTGETTKTRAKQPANDPVTKTGAKQPAYDPVTMPSLASIAGNILSLFSSVFDVGLVFGVWCLGVWCLGLLTIFRVCSILSHFRASFFCQRDDCTGCGTSMVR